MVAKFNSFNLQLRYKLINYRLFCDSIQTVIVILSSKWLKLCNDSLYSAYIWMVLFSVEFIRVRWFSKILTEINLHIIGWAKKKCWISSEIKRFSNGKWFDEFNGNAHNLFNEQSFDFREISSNPGRFVLFFSFRMPARIDNRISYAIYGKFQCWNIAN